ncbi:MAG: type II toxin-antitoxin system PemK/MazF family toxin [Promethearchaeota archaeon]
MKIVKKEVWDVRLSFSGEGKGHKQKYNRPCIIIKNNKFVELATIIPLTKKVNKCARFPYTYIIEANKTNGLSMRSIALIFQIRSLSYKRFINKRGTLQKSDYNSILEIIKDYFSI